MADAPTPTRPRRRSHAGAWQEARALVYAHRRRLAVGLALMLVNRLAGLVLPSSSKWVIDRVINQHHPELLVPLALAAGGPPWSGHHGIRPVADPRRGGAARPSPTCGARCRRTCSGCPSAISTRQERILISRIMTDAEGIRNLVGTGLVQLVGGLITAAIALGCCST